MKLGMVITHTEPEKLFNVLRLANYSLAQGDAAQALLQREDSSWIAGPA